MIVKPYGKTCLRLDRGAPQLFSSALKRTPVILRVRCSRLAMTLEQLEEELPTGLHDAQVRSIARNFENGTLTLEVRILIGLPDDSPGKRDEDRNLGRVEADSSKRNIRIDTPRPGTPPTAHNTTDKPGGRPSPPAARVTAQAASRPPVTFFIPPLHNPVHFGITNRVEDK